MSFHTYTSSCRVDIMLNCHHCIYIDVRTYTCVRTEMRVCVCWFVYENARKTSTKAQKSAKRILAKWKSIIPLLSRKCRCYITTYYVYVVFVNIYIPIGMFVHSVAGSPFCACFVYAWLRYAIYFDRNEIARNSQRFLSEWCVCVCVCLPPNISNTMERVFNLADHKQCK